MKVTVLGGSGFLGSHVADELSKRGHKVIIFDKKKSKWIRSDQKMFIGNILNPNDLENVIKNTDVVFHFAALADLDQALKNPINTVKVNILGTVQVLELCRKHNVKRFIHASTIYVNSTDGGFYRSSKKAAEDYVEEYNEAIKNSTYLAAFQNSTISQIQNEYINKYKLLTYFQSTNSNNNSFLIIIVSHPFRYIF